VLDLVVDLGLPAVVVARSGLGTLNHTALTVTALERRGIEVHAAVCNEYEGSTVAERTNSAVLERMIGVPVYMLPPADLSELEAVITLIRQHLSMSNLDPTLEITPSSRREVRTPFPRS
jgi:dethiobiotin synthetase